MSIHTIQLRGPWQLTPLARTRFTTSGTSEQVEDSSPLPPAGRLNPVGDWSPLLGDFRGKVRYERSFHCPTGLTNERVTLVVDGVDWKASVSLNDQPLGEIQWGETQRFDVREQLKQRNLLRLDIELPASGDSAMPPGCEGRDDKAGGLIGGAWLEIE